MAGNALVRSNVSPGLRRSQRPASNGVAFPFRLRRGIAPAFSAIGHWKSHCEGLLGVGDSEAVKDASRNGGRARSCPRNSEASVEARMLVGCAYEG